MMRIRESLSTIGLLGMAAVACGQQMKAVEAEATYLGQQLRCVDRAATLAESQTCRASVDEAWGIHHTVRDGGAE
jgi:hypothetical protein